MLVKDQFGNELFIGTFACVVKVPSGHAGINFAANPSSRIEVQRPDRFHTGTVILDITFEEFIAEWNRQY